MPDAEAQSRTRTMRTERGVGLYPPEKCTAVCFFDRLCWCWPPWVLGGTQTCTTMGAVEPNIIAMSEWRVVFRVTIAVADTVDPSAWSQQAGVRGEVICEKGPGSPG